MARNHARLLVSIWDDEDWLALTASQQITYAALMSSEDLSWCGVALLTPARLAGISADMTERKIRANLDALQAGPGRFLVIDEKTAEILVRSYVRHDDLLKQPNVTKAMVKSLERVRSDRIRHAVIIELGRKYKEDPDLKGWDTIRSIHPELFEEVLANPSGDPS